MGPSEVRREHEMTNLTNIERKAMEIICNDCDELDGWGFTRPSDACEVVAKEIGQFDAIKVMSRLHAMDLLDICTIDDTLWVKPEVFGQFC